MLKSCEVFFVYAPLRTDKSYGLCQTAWILRDVGFLGK